jgi:diaminopimelate epimerase
MTPDPSAGVQGDPLRADSRFYRAHGLGNDYLVFEAAGPEGAGWPVTPATVRSVCHRGEGEGADGIVVLLGPAPSDGIFPLRMFNPDGSEFERSGNGLRILASHLHREGRVGRDVFQVRSGGSVIPMTVHGTSAGGVFDVSVEMGRARVGADAEILVPGRAEAGDGLPHPSLGPVAFVPVQVGNPHAVVFLDEEPPSTLLGEIGPFLSTHPAFREGTNVQLARVLGPRQLRIWIWERGVGRTPASGTSSCAAAVAAVSTGRLAAGEVELRMDGGVLRVEVDSELGVVLRGPVAEVSEGMLLGGFLEVLEALGEGR